MQNKKGSNDKIDKLAQLMQRGFVSVKKDIAKLDTRMEAGFAAVAEDIADVKEDIVDIRGTMATKDDVKKVDDRVVASENKIVGMYRLDAEKAMQARELNIPRRLHSLEEHAYGPGQSKHPKHVPLH